MGKVETSTSHSEAINAPEPYALVYWNHVKTTLLILAVNSNYFAQLIFLVGGGAFAHSIAAVVGGESLVAWPPTVIVIFIAGLCPPVSQAADYWGRKWFIVLSAAIGCVASIVVSRAQSMNMAIGGFCLAGVAATVSPLMHAVASEVLPRKYRSWAQATVNGSVCLGSIFALCLGGGLTKSNPEGFRTYWYICAGIHAFSGIACALLYNSVPRELQVTLTFSEKIRRLDWPAYFLLTSGLVLFSLGLSWAQNPYPWTNAHVLGPFLVGCVLLIILIFYSWKLMKDGLIHHGLFRERNFPLALGCISIDGMSFMAMNIYIPYSLSVLYSDTMDPFRQALCYSVAFCGFLVASFGAGFYVYQTRTVRGPSMIGFVLFVVCFTLLATVTATTSEAHLWGYVPLCGLGLGFCITTLVTAAQFSTPPELIAVTSGLMLSMRSVGGSIGSAIFNAIFFNGLTNNVAPKVSAAVIPLGFPEEDIPMLLGGLTSGDMAEIAALPNVTPDMINAAVLAMKEAYVIGFRYVFVCAGAFSLAGLVGSGFLRNPSSKFTREIDAPIEIKFESSDDDIKRAEY